MKCSGGLGELWRIPPLKKKEWSKSRTYKLISSGGIHIFLKNHRHFSKNALEKYDGSFSTGVTAKKFTAGFTKRDALCSLCCGSPLTPLYLSASRREATLFHSVAPAAARICRCASAPSHHSPYAVVEPGSPPVKINSPDTYGVRTIILTAGVEPTTRCLEGSCSIQLSYASEVCPIIEKFSVFA